MGAIRRVEVRVFDRLQRQAPTSLLGRLAFWLAIVSAAATAGRWLPGPASKLFALLSFFSVFALFFVFIPLLWRYTVGRFLWKVRNRLIVTYLLMALTPVILFVTLAAIAGYIFLGQFAIFAASAEMDRALHEMSAENRDYTRHLARTLDARLLDAQVPQSPSVRLPEREPDPPLPRLTDLRDLGALIPRGQVAAFLDGRPLKLALGGDSLADHITTVPTWASENFRGVALADGHLFLRALDVERVGKHTITVISSLPLEKGGVNEIAHGLGRITIIPDVSFRDRKKDNASDPDPDPISSESAEKQADAVLPNTVTGGVLPPAENVFDLPVNFYAPLATVDWTTGANHESGVHVKARPSLLYKRLFITSLQVAAYVQDVLVGLAIFFGLLELGAFLMAVRLNQTITLSISDLYTATLAVDNREFSHRIEVRRKDQLAALSASFNTMTASLERLLEEQREKERLLGELEIAQEVQANLYPSGNVSLPTLEVYGICQPARTVSGDYYDFLVGGNAELSLALGDISGKGISAALLMATLHSAVHAYRFAGDDMRESGGVPHDAVEGASPLPLLAASFAEPSQILGLLNRHLYRSTQPEKYATLFLAHYDGRSAKLTYSTGGQLPPLLLRTNDEVVRLDCGGTVIGLMDNMRYDQGTETLGHGDILIAYSDGVTEPENEFGDFGEDRLVELVRRHRRLPLDQIADHVMQALRSWIGTEEQPDDITLVLARQR